MSNVQRMTGTTYQGPATLTAHGEVFAVDALIRVRLEQLFDPDAKLVISSQRSWRAELDGQATPPRFLGDCVLRLPDGREGKASVIEVRGGGGASDAWTGVLAGQGPSPTVLEVDPAWRPS